MFRVFVSFLLASLCASALAQSDAAANSTITFQVTSGGNDNYFLRDNLTSAQLVLASANNTSSARRLVVALPAGNSGALTYFLPLNTTAGSTAQNESLQVTLVNNTWSSTTADFGNVGVQAELSFSGNATLGVTIIGAVRAIRDYVEGAGTMHEIFNYTLNAYNSTFVRLHRQNINSTLSAFGNSSDSNSTYIGADLYLIIPPGSDAQFSVTPGNNGTFAPPAINILVPANSTLSNSTVQVRVLTNETSLVGLNTGSLFLQESQGNTSGLQTALNGISSGDSTVAEQVSFLTFEDKFVAGGWRFLTYFGRDSLIALRLLMPTLSPDAIEAALGAVIERTNSTGALCHEETIGDYASFINIANNQSDLGNKPFYDYKMIDTDLFLLPALSHYFLELPQGRNRSTQFLSRNATLQNGTYAEILNRTISYNLARALPFYSNQTVSNLLAFRPGQPVGNWRDSNQGTGYGPIPFDVNSALVPASLRATAQLAQAGIIAQPAVNINASSSTNLTSNSNVTVAQVADVWETQADLFFEVTVNGSVAEQRLNDFVISANLSSALLAQNGSGNATAANVSFYALSLMTDGSPVQVMNSDLGFNLLYGTNVSRTFLQHVVDLLTPYPRGLLTNVGMVVANPAYDSNTTNIQVLDRTAYHGTVVWSFQQGLMAGGLSRQLGFCSSEPNITVDTNVAPQPAPSWCNDTAFVQSLQNAQTQLWTSIRGAQSNIYSEVWSYSFDNTTNQFSVADLASLSPDGTESDAIQLWSYGFLGLLDPSTNSSLSA